MAEQPPSELIFVCDENLGGLAAVLKAARIKPTGAIFSLREVGYGHGSKDADWMAALGAKGNHVVVTRDSAILNVAAQSAAWRNSGLRLMILDRKWGSLPMAELVRAIVFWWPTIVAYSYSSSPGSAWLVSHKVPDAPAGGIRPVTGSAPPS